MPGMTAITPKEAKNIDALIELKVDGSRHTWDGEHIISDRDIIRDDRFPHIVRQLRKLDFQGRGEVAITSSNVLQLNKRENWPQAKFFLFEVFETKGRNTRRQNPKDNRREVEQIAHVKHISAPKLFDTFQQGWRYVRNHQAEGLVLKESRNKIFKVKLLQEAKCLITGYEKGKKGAFRIKTEYGKGKVSATSKAFLDKYKELKGKEVYAEIEFPFYTEYGTPFQPRLRRIGTLKQLQS